MNKRKTPRIRFKGFTDDWEQRKLGELVDRVVRKNTNNESTLPLTISAQYGLVNQILYFNNRVASRDVSNYYLVLNGEFAYNKSTSDGYPFGAVKRLDLYEKGVLSTLYIVFAPKEDHQIDSDFLTVFFDTDRWYKGVAERASEGARNHGLLNISAENFFDIDLSMPEDIAEQKQIGAIIRNLDHLITLHQRKLEKLKIVKKAMLENCFPKNGEKVPRFRFSGFTGDWEQRKLSELVAKYEDPVETPHGGYIRLGIRSHAKGTFHEYVEPGHELETAKMHRVATNKLIFNITFAWEHAVAIANENDAGKLVSHRFPQFTLLESLRPEFLKYVILDEGFHHNLYLASPGGAGRNRVLKIEEALDYPIYYPSLEEQHKIGGLLNKLNDLITLHQRKLEKLKLIKKSFLEKMFV